MKDKTSNKGASALPNSEANTRKQAIALFQPLSLVDATSVSGAKVVNIGDVSKDSDGTIRTDKAGNTITSKVFVMALPAASTLTGTDKEKQVKLDAIGDKLTEKAEAAIAKAKQNGYKCRRIAISGSGALATTFAPAKVTDKLLRASADTGIPYEYLVKAKELADKASKITVDIAA